MSIEDHPELDLDIAPQGVWSGVPSGADQDSPRLVTLYCSAAHLDRARDALLSLRADGVSGLLVLRAKDTLLDDDELAIVFAWLRDWDQLCLRNFLELCVDWIPEAFHAALQQEAKTEWTWLQQWQAAVNDPRIAKYPGLPWRSFIRRIVGENFLFATEFLDLIKAPSTPENRLALETRVRELLDEKKKAVCIFPKRRVKLPTDTEGEVNA